MKVIIKGRLTDEYLEKAAEGVVRILLEHVPSEQEKKQWRAKHQRIVAMVDELGIVGQKERQEMYDQIVDREEAEQQMARWVEDYWKGERVVCDLGVLDDCEDIRERTRKLFCED